MKSIQNNDEAIKVVESLQTNCKKEWNKPKVNNLSEIPETESNVGAGTDASSSGS